MLADHGATFILVHTKQADAAKAKDVLEASSEELVLQERRCGGGPARLTWPCRGSVKDLIHKSWGKIVGPEGKPVYH